MKIISGSLAGVFEESRWLMGFSNFCITLYEDPDLIKAITDKVGSFLLNVVRNCADFPDVGGIWHSDDCAYKTSTMIAPELMRRYIFPWYKKMGDVCKLKGLPFLYHSDGYLWPVFDDLIACGYNAVQALEPEAIDIAEVKKEYGDKLCLIGSISIDTLAKGTLEDVEREVKQRIKTVAPGGGFAVGSSSSVANYIPLENYLAMIEATRKYGRYPISV